MIFFRSLSSAKGPELSSFRSYATEEWSHYARTVQEDPVIAETIISFFSTPAPSSYLSWLDAWTPVYGPTRWFIERDGSTERRPLAGIFYASYFDLHSIVEALLKSGESPDGLMDDSAFPIHAAAYAGNINILQLLLRAGANVKAKNCQGDAPLHLAVYYAYIDVVELLLSHGAEVNERNKQLQTPLAVAMIDRGSLQTYIPAKLTQVLLEAGASVNLPDIDGQTPLHKAASRFDYKDIVPSWISIKYTG